MLTTIAAASGCDGLAGGAATALTLASSSPLSCRPPPAFVVVVGCGSWLSACGTTMAGAFAAAGICVASAPLAVGAFGCGAVLPGPPVAFFVLAPGIAPPLASDVWTGPPVAFGTTSEPAPTLGVQLAPVAFVGGFVSPVALRIGAALFAAFGGAVKRPPLVFGAVVEPPFAFSPSRPSLLNSAWSLRSWCRSRVRPGRGVLVGVRRIARAGFGASAAGRRAIRRRGWRLRRHRRILRHIRRRLIPWRRGGPRRAEARSLGSHLTPALAARPRRRAWR